MDEKLSRGGLIKPIEEWLNKVKQMEIIFGIYHGQDISRTGQVIETLCKQIKEKFPNLHQNIIKLYVRTRTFIRLNHLNISYKQQQRERNAARKARKWQASSCPSSTKMKIKLLLCLAWDP